MKNTLKSWFIKMTIEEVQKRKGTQLCVSSPEGMANDLLAPYIEAGSLAGDAFEAENWIAEHFHEIGELYENIGKSAEQLVNPLANPEFFQVQIMRIGVEDVLARCEFWNRCYDIYSTQLTDEYGGIYRNIISDLEEE